MKTIRFRGVPLLTIFLVLVVITGAWAESLTPAQMYLDPTAVTADYYDYNYFTTGYTATFSNVSSLQVLPPLTTDGTSYYYNPGTDYYGDITGTDGSITFVRPGPYFVLATYSDNSSEIFDFGIEFQDRGDTDETYNWKVIPTPEPDIVITDPNPYPNPSPPPATLTLPPSNPNFPAGTNEINNLTTWQEVLNYLKNVQGSNLHVELGGHGSTGAFYWNGQSIPASDFAALKGKVSNLTFMSCKTGAGSCSYLTEIAGYLGQAGGYTDVVGGDGSEWFINDDGYFKSVPEPFTWTLLSLGCITMIRRRRSD